MKTQEHKEQHMKHNMIARLALASAVAVAIAVFGATASQRTTAVTNHEDYQTPQVQERGLLQRRQVPGGQGQEAYFDMMAAYGYPVPESLRTNMWATDFGLGDFVNVGMAGIFWVNSQEAGYFAHEIYLLPGQMIVEHASRGDRERQGEDGKLACALWQHLHARRGGRAAAAGSQTAEEPGTSTSPCPRAT